MMFLIITHLRLFFGIYSLIYVTSCSQIDTLEIFWPKNGLLLKIQPFISVSQRNFIEKGRLLKMRNNGASYQSWLLREKE